MTEGEAATRRLAALRRAPRTELDGGRFCQLVPQHVRRIRHATVVLKGWHRLAMNTEHRARAMRHVMFFD